MAESLSVAVVAVTEANGECWIAAVKQARIEAVQRARFEALRVVRGEGFKLRRLRYVEKSL